MRILVCGGREFKDAAKLSDILLWLHQERCLSLIIHGDAKRGADRMARDWAKKNGIKDDPHPADWSDLSHPDADIRTRADGTKFDARAGFRRNQKMIDLKPDLVVAFPTDGNLKESRGTADTVRRAKIAHIEVMVIGNETER